MTTMVQALTEIITVEIGNFLISMTIAEKENESGLKFNQRLFVLIHGEAFGYLSKVKMTDDPNKIDLDSFKTKVQLKNLYSAETDEEILKIKFTIFQNNKFAPKEWYFKMNTPKLANLWKQLIDYQLLLRKKQGSSQGKNSKKNTEKDKDSKSPAKTIKKEAQPLKNPNLSFEKVNEMKIQNKVNKQPEVINPIIKRPEQKETNNNPVLSKNKVFLNPLFQEDGSQSQQEIKKKNNKKSPHKPINQSFEQKKQIKVQEKQIEKPFQKKQEEKVSFILDDRKIQQKIEKKPSNINKSEIKIELQNEKVQIQRQNIIQKEDENKQKMKILPGQNERNHEDLHNEKAELIVPEKHLDKDELLDEPTILVSPNSPDNKARLIKEEIQNQKKLLSSENQLNLSMNNAQKSNLRESTNKKISIQSMKFVQKLVEDIEIKSSKLPISKISYEPNEAQKIRKTYQFKQNITNEEKSHHLEMIHEYVMEIQRNKAIKIIQQAVERKSTFTFKYITQDETNILLEFKQICERKMKQLVMELCQKNKQKSKNVFMKIKEEKSIAYYENDDLEIKLALISSRSSTKQEPLNKKESNGYEIGNFVAVKKLQNQFKSYKYLYKIIANRGTFRVPLTCICQFAGFLALFKIKSEFFINSKQITPSTQEDIKKICLIAKLETDFLKENCQSQIYPLNSKYYDDFKVCGLPKTSFNLYFLQEINQFFIQDVNQHHNNYEQTNQFREEFLDQELQMQVPYVNKSKNTAKQLKVLHQLANNMLSKIDKILPLLDNLEFYYICPSELQQFLHSNGINIRYLGTIYQKLTTPYVKELILSDIAARVSKNFFRKVMQDFIHQSKHVQKQQFIEELHLQINDFLNCLLGKSYESETLWKVLETQAQDNFSINLQKTDIDKKQFFINLVHYLSLDIDWKNLKTSDIFQSDNFIHKDMILNIKIKSKNYTPVNNQNVFKFNELIKHKSTENFHELVTFFNLKNNSFPEFLILTRSIKKFKKYLSQFIEPEQSAWASEYSSLQIYENPKISKESLKIELNMIKWFLRFNKKDRFLLKFTEFTRKIENLFGSFHPILSELYGIFSEYHLRNKQFSDAITFASSSLLNMTKLCGEYHLLTSQKMYELGLCFLSASKMSQALDIFKKAKQSQERCSRKNLGNYGKIKLHIGLLQSHFQRYQQCFKECEQLVEIFEIYQKKSENNFEEERILTYSLLKQSYESLQMKLQLTQISLRCGAKLNFFANIDFFRKLLWIFVENIVKTSSQINFNSLKWIFNEFPLKNSIVFYKKSYQFLRKRTIERSFEENIRSYFESASVIVKMIQQKNLLMEWKSLTQSYERETIYDFVSLIEELLYFLGADRLIGVTPDY